MVLLNIEMPLCCVKCLLKEIKKNNTQINNNNNNPLTNINVKPLPTMFRTYKYCRGGK